MTGVARKHPRALFLMIPMLLAFGIFGACRVGKLLAENRVLGRMNNEMSMFTVMTARFYEIIKDYKQRPLMNDEFAERAKESTKAAFDPRQTKLNNSLFGTCVGPICIGLYITIFSEFVFNGTLALGSFLAMVNVIKTIGENMNQLFEDFMVVLSSAGPVRSLTTMMNQSTDAETLMLSERRRIAETQERKNAVASMYHMDHADACENTSIFDLLPIQLTDVGFSFTPQNLLTVSSLWLFRHVTATILQGTVNGVTGANKGAMMALLGQRKQPHEGSVFTPTHLRVLYIPPEPVVLNLSCWKNLTFGIGYMSHVDVRAK